MKTFFLTALFAVCLLCSTKVKAQLVTTGSGAASIFPNAAGNANQNLGIGINAPIHPLHIQCGDYNGGTANPVAVLSANFPNNGILIEKNAGPSGAALYLQYTATAAGRRWGLVSGGTQNSAAGNFIISDLTAGQDRLTITSNGNVGIGTTAPQQQLHTTAGVIFSGLTNNDNLTQVIVSDNTGRLFFRNAGTLGANNAWQLNGNAAVPTDFLGTTNASDLRIRTNNTQRMVVAAQGNVGINTASPTAFLHVNCAGGNEGGSLSDVRFEGLEAGLGSVLVIDKFGYVHNSGVSPSGISNSCTTINMLPKVADANGNLACSQVYDDGNFVGIATTSPYFVNGVMSKLNVNGLTVSNSFYALSDGKYKQQVEDISDATSIINKLRGVTYNWNKTAFAGKNFESGRQAGFIAQEVNKVFPLSVGIDKENNYVVNYNAFIPLLTRGQQELYNMVSSLEEKNKDLQKEIVAMQAQLTQSNSNKDNSLVPVKSNAAENKLYQNKPNPFNNATTIEYDLVKMKNSGFIIICDLSGKELLRFKIDRPGHGSFQVNSGQLLNGMYLYSLIIDGEETDTRKMVVLKN